MVASPEDADCAPSLPAVNVSAFPPFSASTSRSISARFAAPSVFSHFSESDDLSSGIVFFVSSSRVPRGHLVLGRVTRGEALELAAALFAAFSVV